MAIDFKEYLAGELSGFRFLDVGDRLCLLHEADTPDQAWLGLRDAHRMSLDRETAAGLIERLQVFVDTGKL